MEATYRMLSTGNWGIRVEGAANVGDVVLARRVNGQARNVRVVSIVWSGNERMTGKLTSFCTFEDIPVERKRRKAKAAPAPEARPIEHDEQASDEVPY